ncbi:Type IV secretion system protein virB8 [Burkholderia latens]|uniref:virB8 family protein n=1 Tax=Burkholderia latens TaxID=488446 RepID=UPI0039A4060B
MSLPNVFARLKGVKSDDLDAYFEEARGAERDLHVERERSRKTAWIVAGVACFGCLLSFGTLMVHIKETSRPTPPFILRVDNATGTVDSVSVMKETQSSYGEVVDRYWLTQYVMHRESYDFQTIQADYDATGLMSTSDVAAEYAKVFSGDQARDKMLGDKARILVQIDSPPIVNEPTSTATVRFTTVVHWKTGNRPDEVRHWVATVAYSYVDAPMKPADRLINPLGFQVTSYRVDPELGVTR